MPERTHPRELRGATIVLTGASSGIGRAAARAFAREGAHLFLGARRLEALEEVAGECAKLGGDAVARQTDVTDEAQVERLAAAAVSATGRLDVWVNNAAVSLFGAFEETPSDAFRRVIDVDLMGYVYGARAALRHFREQGRGVLIDVASIVAITSQPYTAAYAAAKHAIRGLNMSLRQELLLDGDVDIHVCTVLPGSTDTPLFQHAGNYTGRAVIPIPPVVPPERVAEALVRAAREPKREVFIDFTGRLVDLQQRVAPTLTETVVAAVVNREHFADHRGIPATPGNLFEPQDQWRSASGGWGTTGRLPASASRWAPVLGVFALLPAWLAWSWLRPHGAR